MTRKGQPKVRTGCLTCKSRKVKCDEAKPACVRCTSTGRKCDGYAVVVPSNRALARARSRTMRLNAALAQASAAWDGSMDEEKVLEHFRRKIAPMMPGNLDGHFWTDIMPRMSRTQPALRHAMAAISTLMPGVSDDGLPPEAGPIDPCAMMVASSGEGNSRWQRSGAEGQVQVQLQLQGGQTRPGSNPFNMTAAAAIDSPATSSPASYSPTNRLSATPYPETTNRTELQQQQQQQQGPKNPLTVPQPYEEDGDSVPRVNTEVNVALTGCILFVAVDFLQHGLEAAMEQVAAGIEVLNNVDYNDLTPATISNVVPQFYRLSIIQLCFHDKPGFPALTLGGPKYDLGPFDKTVSIYRPQCAIDRIILDAIRCIRAASPSQQTDSRLASRGPVMSEEQTAVRDAFDKWHAAFTAFIRERRSSSLQPLLPARTDVICAEMEMKYLAAKVCISVCRSHDESVYDYFKDHFRRITALARDIHDSAPETSPEPAEHRFSFHTSYLPLLEFVIAKCRWLDIRYRAWLIVGELAHAPAPARPVTLGNLYQVGKRMIEREHNAEIVEINGDNAHLFSLPAEEMRVKDYTTDPRFSDLVSVARQGDDGGSGLAQVPYPQRLLLRCGSYELDALARWVIGDAASP